MNSGPRNSLWFLDWEFWINWLTSLGLIFPIGCALGIQKAQSSFYFWLWPSSDFSFLHWFWICWWSLVFWFSDFWLICGWGLYCHGSNVSYYLKLQSHWYIQCSIFSSHYSPVSKWLCDTFTRIKLTLPTNKLTTLSFAPKPFKYLCSICGQLNAF